MLLRLPIANFPRRPKRPQAPEAADQVRGHRTKLSYILYPTIYLFLSQ